MEKRFFNIDQFLSYLTFLLIKKIALSLIQGADDKFRVSDPYSFFTDPDPEDPDGGQYGSGSGSNPDPGL
jgi:hypothetical protein